MAEPVRACNLLRRAREVYDAPSCPLGPAARSAWRRGFASGGHWMQLALAHLRGCPAPAGTRGLNALGVIKYGLAGMAAQPVLLAAVWLPCWPLLLLSVLAFYAIEAQMVFLFPLALDGNSHPFREARRWTARAGGTWAVMRVVLPVAALMLFGGFARQGFVRAWCLGCLAICLWYEDLRTSPAGQGRSEALGHRPWRGQRSCRLGPFEFGAFGPLTVRPEEVCLGVGRRVRLLYASDLHLGHWWTRDVPAQLLDACSRTRPDLILLGGDLADCRHALASLRDCVRALTAVAPVAAIPGNHDQRPGVPNVRAHVEEAGGHWLLDRALEQPLRIDAALDKAPRPGPRLLCAHHPDVFPAAVQAGYRLVLAGHLHGGQCVLATVRGRLYPAVWLHRWHGLRFTEGNAVLLVSRGVADTLPFRWNCPREVILCEIC